MSPGSGRRQRTRNCASFVKVSSTIAAPILRAGLSDANGEKTDSVRPFRNSTTRAMQLSAMELDAAPPHNDCSDEQGIPLVLSGLMGALICCNLSNVELRACSEASRQLNSLASESVKALAPRHGHCLQLLSKRFPSITSLDLSKDEGQAAGVGGLRNVLLTTASFKQLKHLKLQKSLSLSDSTLQHLASSSSIESIDFRGSSKLTWAGLAHLSFLPNLRRLNCSGIKHVGHDPCTDSAGLHQMLGRLNSLTMGDACTLSWVDDHLMSVVGRHAAQLTHLDCGGCIDMTDRGVSHISGLTQLQSLSLQSCVRITNGSLASVAELTNLKELNIRGCLQINDSGLKRLCSLHLLEKLGLSCCLGMHGLDADFFACLKSLRSLNVSNCTSLDSLAAMSALAPTLVELNISSCSKLTLMGLEALSSLTALTSLDMSNFNNLVRVPVGRQLELQRLSCLTNLQVLRLSRFRHPQGLPTGLLQAVAGMAGLRELHMSGCTPEAAPPPSAPLSPRTSDAAGTDSAAADASSGSGSQLWFLERLTNLRSLDLAGWRHASPLSLLSLSGLSQLTKLKLQRYGNDVVAPKRNSSGCQADAASVHSALSPVLCPKPAPQLPPGVTAAASRSGDCTPLSSPGDCTLSPRPSDGSPRLVVTEDADAPQPAARSSISSSICLSAVELKMAAVNLSCNASSSGSSSSSSSSGSSERSTAFSAGVVVPGCCSAGAQLWPLDTCCSASSQQSTPQSLAYSPAAAAAAASPASTCFQPQPAAGPASQEHCRDSDAPEEAVSLEQGLACLEGMQRLEVLDMEACLSLEDDSLFRIARLPSLKQLNLAGCKRLKGTSLAVLSAPAPAPGAAAHAAAAGCPQLEEVCLDDCPAVSDLALTGIARLGSLSRLSLKGCTLVGDAGLEAIAARLHRLTHLSLYGAAAITSKGVESLARLPGLQSLQLPHCWNVDDAGMQALARCDTLLFLSISHCWRLSHSTIKELMQAKPMLTILHSQLKPGA